MRAHALTIIAVATIALAASTLAPRPAAACVSFDFDAELAAVDRALASTQLPSGDAAEVAALRNKAVEIDQQAARLLHEITEMKARRNVAMLQALGKLGLKPIVLTNDPAGSEEGAGTAPISRCG